MPGERFVKTQQQTSTRRRGNGDTPVAEPAQRAVWVKMHGGLGRRRAAPVGTQAIEQQAYTLGLLQRLADQCSPAELQQHAFRARGQQRAARPDQDFVGARSGRRQIEQLDRSSAQVLDKLARTRHLGQAVVPSAGACPVRACR